MSQEEHRSVEKFKAVCKVCGETFEKKNKAYGDAIWKTGVLGAVVELIGATARLPQMVLRNKQHGRDIKESLIDVLLDIHNYAAIGIMMVDADNWEGEE